MKVASSSRLLVAFLAAAVGILSSCERASGTPHSGSAAPSDAVGVPARGAAREPANEAAVRSWVEEIRGLAAKPSSRVELSDKTAPACQTNCERATQICELSHKICERADEEPDNVEHASYCREAKTLCSDAWSACQACAHAAQRRNSSEITQTAMR